MTNQQQNVNQDVRSTAEFGVFDNPTSWLLQRGPPPWLDDPRWHVRAIRASWVLGILGLASFSLTSVCFLAVPSHEPIAVILFFAPGVWFGLVTLMPLSRWLGRGWFMTLSAVPISIVASWCGVIAFLCCSRQSLIVEVANRRDSVEFGGFAGGFVMALMVSAWMGHPSERQSWRAGLYATGLASLGCGFGLMLLGLPGFDGSAVVMIGIALFTLQCVVPVCLGMRLWSESPFP